MTAQTTFIGTTNGTSQWTNAAIWSGGSVPNAVGAVVNFTNVATNNGVQWANANFTVGTLNFSNSSGSVIIGDNSITSDNLTLATSTGKPVLNVANSSGTAFIYATLLGTNGFTKTGAGNLSFRFNTTPMTYTGDINLNAGTLTINQDSSLGDANNDIIVGGNSTLSFSPGSNTGAGSLSAGRSISINNGSTLSLQTLNTSTALSVNGVISDAGGLTFIGTGTGNTAANSLSYTLNGANTYAGQTTIQMGAKVTLGSGSAVSTNTLSLSGGTGSFAQLDLGGMSQTVASLTTASSNATARTMVISNGALNVGNGGAFTLNGINGTTVNMSGLTSFTFNGAAGNRNFTITPDTVSAAATNTNSVFLANTGIASNNISAAAITVGGATGTSQGGDHQAQLYLGKVNSLFANSLTVGGFNGSGLIALQSGITDGSLLLRGSNGVSRMGTLIVGAISSGVRSGAGTLNISNGTIDASINNTYVGLFGANSTGPNTTSLLAMGGGSFDALNMSIATITNTTLTNASASTTGTFQQNGGTAKIQALTLGDSASAGNTNATKSTLIANYNLSSSNSILHAQTIQAGTSTTDYSTSTRRKINFGAGTIRNYDSSTDLIIQGIDTSLQGRLEIAVASNASSRTFLADAGRKITVKDTAVITSTGGITKDGAGSLILEGANSYSGGTTVLAGLLRVNNTSGSGTGTGGVTVVSGASLGGSGIISGATTISGTLSPGNSPGVLTFGSDLTLNTGGNMVWELWGNTVVNSPVTYDQTVVGGNLNVAGSFGTTLDFGTLAGGSTVDWGNTFWDSERSWVLFDVTGTTSGALNLNLLNSAYNDANGVSLATARSGASFNIAQVGSDVVVNYVPEPSPTSLILVGLGALAAVRTFRRRA